LLIRAYTEVLNMLAVICCNGYYTVATTNVRADALSIARAHKDGDYACVIFQEGRIIGDCVDGYYDESGADICDGLDAQYAAQYAYACGYYD
jgi:hypothetical protein